MNNSRTGRIKHFVDEYLIPILIKGETATVIVTSTRQIDQILAIIEQRLLAFKINFQLIKGKNGYFK